MLNKRLVVNLFYESFACLSNSTFDSKLNRLTLALVLLRSSGFEIAISERIYLFVCLFLPYFLKEVYNQVLRTTNYI